MELRRVIEYVISSVIVSKTRKRGSAGQYKYDALTAGFVCLATNARPGYLHDQAALTVGTALMIVQSLATKLPKCFKNIMVIEFAQDILFVNYNSVMEHCESSLIHFINVGGEHPVVGEDYDTLSILIKELKTWKSKGHEIQSEIFQLNEELFTSGPSVIGLLLGFPIVYYLDNKCSHCLDCVSLHVTKCTLSLAGNSIDVCSFTIPVQCITSDIIETLARWKEIFRRRMESLNLPCNIVSNESSFSRLML